VDGVANPVQHRYPCQNDGVLQTLVYNDESWRLEAGASLTEFPSWSLGTSTIQDPHSGMDGFELTLHGTGYPLPASMASLG